MPSMYPYTFSHWTSLLKKLYRDVLSVSLSTDFEQRSRTATVTFCTKYVGNSTFLTDYAVRKPSFNLTIFFTEQSAPTTWQLLTSAGKGSSPALCEQHLALLEKEPISRALRSDTRKFIQYYGDLHGILDLPPDSGYPIIRIVKVVEKMKKLSGTLFV